ncbi:putative ripening-related protein 2 [Carex littledalei]|uniref:Putative ripening-related protein 2 n=1 Tax=Carex littledalei TaxID=544730 RepID=A0A833QRL8_9POAL|nr:putative ripening-related protein 2 [Carex littledalei]
MGRIRFLLFPLITLYLLAHSELTLVTGNRKHDTCKVSGYLTGKAGTCNPENDSECCVTGQLYPQYNNSPPVTRYTHAVMTLNSFEAGGDGDCDVSDEQCLPIYLPSDHSSMHQISSPLPHLPSSTTTQFTLLSVCRNFAQTHQRLALHRSRPRLWGQLSASCSPRDRHVAVPRNVSHSPLSAPPLLRFSLVFSSLEITDFTLPLIPAAHFPLSLCSEQRLSFSLWFSLCASSSYDSSRSYVSKNQVGRRRQHHLRAKEQNSSTGEANQVTKFLPPRFPLHPCSPLRLPELPLCLSSTAATPSTVVDPARLSHLGFLPLVWSV